MNFRVGFGNDIHKLAEGRELVIGGIKIPYHKGCVAHSDGDVLIHALCDALLGAVALKDIGNHFPDNNPAFKNISSAVLLKKVYDIIKNQNYIINNIDSTIILEKPKLSTFIDSIRNNLAEILEIDVSKISVKAKTNEELDEIGKNNAVAAYCIVSICNAE
ncbi:MAG: 2-C-methyl-D-erythritol 2,4-cyclodiphosphate synthase [Bacteroidales bacterium]|jgi:2-C-methyl-D-erythritol 2,4-cyclodiphosphate synthase|nr:2-C-methyl-D-erythritol 2,4-cyclodiphosphate synthase [Bacteroidales bacterium]